ncbi:hypothetical protein V5O48_015237 [Marasmius crinis-equi]|uniref:Uncharacterized protein n=1 Tax=Marasmius crinis-equi TaxID=585013 RepID=A0ABR3EV32_9AGAR
MPSIPPASQSSQVPDGMGPDPSAVGTLFVANLVLFLLFGVISVQMYLYHLTSSIDRGVVRATVYGIYALLFVQLVMCGRDGYVRFSSLSQNGIGLGWFFVPVIGGIVGFGVQMFYAWRIYILSQRRPIPAFLLALSATSAIAAFASAGYGSKVGTVQSLGDSSGIRISTAIWYSTSAFCDLVIAGYMIYLVRPAI